METSIFDSALLVGALAAFASALPAYLAFKRSLKADAIAEQAGIATAENGTIGQVIDGLNKLVANLQADNEILRQQLVASKQVPQTSNP